MSPIRAMADLPRVVLLTGLFSPVWALYLYFPAFRTRRVLVFLGVTTTVMVASFYSPTLVGWVVRVVVLAAWTGGITLGERVLARFSPAQLGFDEVLRGIERSVLRERQRLDAGD